MDRRTLGTVEAVASAKRLKPRISTAMKDVTRQVPRFGVVIPCFNEEQTIADVIKDFRTALPEATIYVIDNNSTDLTSEKAKAAGAQVIFEVRRGKGNVVRSIVRKVDADIYVMVDGDRTYPADAVKKLMDPLLAGKADMVVGDRLSNAS